VNIADWLPSLHHEAQQRAYISRLVVIDQSASLLKARMYITTDLFVQVYRNDRFDTTNLALMYNEQRIYARDQLGGVWHRHTADDPQAHDTGVAGRRSVSLTEFLDEVEDMLAALGLP
jgi:hypothetical protein